MATGKPGKLKDRINGKTGDMAGSGMSRLKEKIADLEDQLAQAQKQSADGADSESLIRWVHPADLSTEEPFRSLFPVRPALLERITESMRNNGFDATQPLIVWEGKNVVIDGHTRLQAALDLEITTIPVFDYPLKESEILEATLAFQVNRRNMQDGDILNAVEQLMSQAESASTHKSKTTLEIMGSIDCSSEQSNNSNHYLRDEMAKLLNQSATKVQRAMRVINKAPANIKEAVLSNDISINKAYNTIIEQEEAAQPQPKKNKPLPPPDPIYPPAKNPDKEIEISHDVIKANDLPLLTIHQETLYELGIPWSFRGKILRYARKVINQEEEDPNDDPSNNQEETHG